MKTGCYANQSEVGEAHVAGSNSIGGGNAPLACKFRGALSRQKPVQQAIDPFRQNWPRPELLLPVLLHRNRLLEHGYSQAREIAQVLSAELDIPTDRRAFTRQRDTPVQSGLSTRQQVDNVCQAFAWLPRHNYRHVAVDDDIVTTGSTATEITSLLHREGVEYIEIWALARANRRRSKTRHTRSLSHHSRLYSVIPAQAEIF